MGETIEQGSKYRTPSCALLPFLKLKIQQLLKIVSVFGVRGLGTRQIYPPDPLLQRVGFLMLHLEVDKHYNI